MKNAKNLIVLMGVLVLACTPNDEETLTAGSLSRDPIFKAIMEQNLVLKEKLNTALENKSGRVETELSNIRKSIEEGNYETLVLQLGYLSVSEFETLNLKLYNSYLELFRKYPSIERGGQLYRDAASIYFIDREFQLSKNSNARIAVGCAGGVACFRAASNCNHDAEVDYAVASSMCLSLRWFPPYWGLCQGSANLVYIADIAGCDYDLDKCCKLDGGVERSSKL
jgi:hypothetical protein